MGDQRESAKCQHFVADKESQHIAGNGDPITRIGLTALQVMGVPIERWGTGSLETTKTISQVLV